MRIYDDTKSDAPSPRKVRVFLAEKGLDVPLVQIDIHKRESRTPEFKRKNPMGSVPVLELDDGTCISDSVAICRYFEHLHPDPPLLGESAEERGLVEMWMRRVELHLYLAIDLSGAFKDVAEAEASCRKTASWMMRFLDGELSRREFIAGDRYTAPDGFAMCALDFGIRYVGYELPGDLTHLARWHAAVSARPSAAA